MRPKQSLGLLALVLLILTGTTRAQQDFQLREKAVTLVERANAASIAQPFAPYEQTIVFRAYRAGKGSRKAASPASPSALVPTVMNTSTETFICS